MTISAEARRKQEEELIAKLTNLLGDEVLIGMLFHESSFPDILNTTWYSLYNRGILDHSKERGTDGFYLTPRGWLIGLDLTGRINESEFLDRVGRLCAAVKKHVKDRREDALVYARDLEAEANLPFGWLANMISANVIEERFGRTGPHWAKGLFIQIPVDVGIKF
jgi:hypothetical protein